MSKQTLNKGSAANDGTGDTLRVGAQKINENFTELYNLLGGSSLSSGVSLDATTKGIVFTGVDSSDSFETNLVPDEPTADRTITLPNSTGTVVLHNATQTLTNKTLTTPQINDTSSDHQYVVAVSELAADRNVTLPLLTGNDEFTFNAHIQTLTNKTLTAPTITTPAITSPKITTEIQDANANTVLTIPAPSGTIVNNLKITSSVTNASPTLEAVGTDDDIGINISAKGAGLLTLTGGLSLTDESLSGGTPSISLATTTTIFTRTSDVSASLANGTDTGQLKILSVKGAGTVTITITSFAPGNTLTLQEHEGAILLWDGNEWGLISTYGGAVG